MKNRKQSKKLKNLKVKFSLIIIAILIILIAILGSQLSTNNANIVDNLKNLGGQLVNNISNDIDPSFANSLSSFMDTSQGDSDFSNTTKNTSENTAIDENISEASYKVTRVVDGDTIIIDYNGKEERVRLIGVDTPESVHPNAEKNTEFGKTASNFTKQYLENKYVKIELDVQERDKYGRLLSYVYLDDVMYNKILLQEGYAKIATYPPNVKYVNDFTEIQKEAQSNKKGLWGLE